MIFSIEKNKNVLKLGFEFCQFSYREAKINFKFFLKSGLKKLCRAQNSCMAKARVDIKPDFLFWAIGGP